MLQLFPFLVLCSNSNPVFYQGSPVCLDSLVADGRTPSLLSCILNMNLCIKQKKKNIYFFCLGASGGLLIRGCMSVGKGRRVAESLRYQGQHSGWRSQLHQLLLCSSSPGIPRMGGGLCACTADLCRKLEHPVTHQGLLSGFTVTEA